MSDNPFDAKGLGDLMQQLQQAQSQLQNIEKDMEDKQFSADAGGGLVKATVNGRLELLAIKIDPKAVDPDDAGMLEDLLVTAVNRALTQARDAMAQQMTQGLFGGKMPGLF